ncbi:MAG: phosphoenolpyruvate--protein phosphotransferase [Pseudomonadota bacterium]
MNHKTPDNPNKLQGIPVSPGIIIGKARLVDRSRVKILYQYLVGDKQVNGEAERFREALNAVKTQINALKEGMPEQIRKHAFILDAHLMILNDSMFADSTLKRILEEKINAEWALRKSIQSIRQLFEQIDDEYISERFQDVENVADRVLRNLAGKEQESPFETKERVIIVAHDLSPVDTSALNIAKVMGFITDVGGRTSHTAIMSKSLKIPAVVGLESVSHRVQDGTLLIVDGGSGEVIIDPDDRTIIAYQEKQLQNERYESSIVRISHLPAETIDGHRVSIRANIEFVEEVSVARDHGAEGIGLYRTEFLYLRSQGIPAEEELFEDYKEVAELMAPEPVTIRTLDLGGDKFSSNLGFSKEINPALGLRAVRFCLKEPDIFRKQLRAILRASAYGNIRLMFPMISGLQEILDVKEILESEMDKLDRENAAFDRDMEIGIMIEIPSAVTVADILARHVDFFSIGTNDLIQYALAIDRINEHVAFMYQPFHPAILRMIDMVVKAARDAGISVALCGEMAGDPLCAYILLGLGIDEFSVNAGGIPAIKQTLRLLSKEEAGEDMKKIFQLDTATRVKEFVTDKMRNVLPELDFRGLYKPH